MLSSAEKAHIKSLNKHIRADYTLIFQYYKQKLMGDISIGTLKDILFLRDSWSIEEEITYCIQQSIFEKKECPQLIEVPTLE